MHVFFETLMQRNAVCLAILDFTFLGRTGVIQSLSDYLDLVYSFTYMVAHICGLQVLGVQVSHAIIKKVHLLIVRITALVGSPRWNVKLSMLFELFN